MCAAHPAVRHMNMNANYHHPDLREALIRATRTIVEADGIEAVSLSRIAQACGVSVAAPYRHFIDKADLLADVAGDGFTDLGATLTESMSSADSTRERLLLSGDAYIQFALAHPHLFRLMFTEGLRAALPPSAPAALNVLAQVLNPDDLSVDPLVALHCAWGIVHGLATLRVGGMLSEESDRHRRHAELEALLDGILT